MPPMVITLGDYVLFDLEKLTAEKNSTFSSKLSGLGYDGNFSNPFGDYLAMEHPETRYYRKTITFLVVCCVMMLIILATKIGGCLEGRGSEAAQNITVGIVGLISSFFTIPLYRHLLTGLDCTYRASGMGPNGTHSGFEWDPAADVFDDTVGYQKQECYGAWALNTTAEGYEDLVRNERMMKRTPPHSVCLSRHNEMLQQRRFCRLAILPKTFC